jgi:hypothetical protein
LTSWRLVDADKLDADLINRLFNNEIAGIRVPDFVSPDTAAAFADAVVAHGFDHYRDVEPPIGRIGITQFEHRHDDAARSSYFEHARTANEQRRKLFAGGADLFETVLEQVRQVWPHPVGLAIEADGSEYFGGLVRMIGAALLHCDWAPRDAPGWRISEVDAQITWNIYYSRSMSGGATVIFNRPWTPDAEDLIVDGSYGYRPELVRDAASVRFEPTLTDLVLFNSRNFHMVEPSAGDAPRISLSSFIGRGSDRSAMAWS